MINKISKNISPMNIVSFTFEFKINFVIHIEFEVFVLKDNKDYQLIYFLESKIIYLLHIYNKSYLNI